MQTIRVQGSGFTRLISRQSGAGSILVSNTSLTVTVFLTDKDVGNPATTDSVTLGPNASKTFDGSSDVYGFVTGGSADVEVIEGGVATFLGLTQSSGALVLPSIRSPNFNIANPPASPANSWALLSNGLAYIFGLTLSGGTITGPDYIVNTDGFFIYTGVPAAGNLSVSMVPGTVNVTDPKGNVALPGFTAYNTPLAVTSVALNIDQGQVEWFQWSGVAWTVGPSIDWQVSGGFIEVINAAWRVLSGITVNEVTFVGEATPVTPGVGFTDVYGNNNSGQTHLKYVSDDGTDYATGRQTVLGPNNQLVNAVAFADLTGLVLTFGPGTHKFAVKVQLKANASAGQWKLLLHTVSGSAASSSYGMRFIGATAGDTSCIYNVTAMGTVLNGPAVSTLGFYEAVIEGELTTTIGVTLQVQGATSVAADTFNVFKGSSFESVPVV